MSQPSRKVNTPVIWSTCCFYKTCGRGDGECESKEKPLAEARGYALQVTCLETSFRSAFFDSLIIDGFLSSPKVMQHFVLATNLSDSKISTHLNEILHKMIDDKYNAQRCD